MLLLYKCTKSHIQRKKTSYENNSLTNLQQDTAKTINVRYWDLYSQSKICYLWIVKGKRVPSWRGQAIAALHFLYFMSNPVTYVFNVLSHCSMNLLTLTETHSTRASGLLDNGFEFWKPKSRNYVLLLIKILPTPLSYLGLGISQIPNENIWLWAG